MSPTPVGVILSSAKIAPIKPAEIPSRRPAKMTGEAAGITIRNRTDVREARKDLPISLNDSGVFRTAPLVFKTITGIAMIQTTKTFEVNPMPYANTNSGISAANGAACMTIKIGEKSQSKKSFNPTQRPSPIPRTAEIIIPMTNGRSVSL